MLMCNMSSSCWLLTLILARVSVAAAEWSSNDNNIEEYCIMDTFRPRCTHGDVISMTTAQFGRMRVGRCITSDAFKLQQLEPDSLGCSANVLEYFDRICSGKSACDVPVSNPDLYGYRPCSAQLTVYLEASYTCISVVDEDRSCSVEASIGATAYVSISPKTPMSNQRNGDAGYRCGSRLNPWIIEAQIGQQINISLLDFGQQSRRSRSNDDISNKPSVAEIKGQTQEACAVQYGYIMEKAAAAGTVRNMSVCSGYGDLQRNRFVYQSRGSSVEIVFSSSNFTSDSQHKLLFGFEAVGCTNLMPPADAWLRRNGNEATVGCFMTRQVWHLRCQGGQWTGALGLCTNHEWLEDATEPGAQAVKMLSENATFFNALMILAVAFVGLAICLVIIFTGIGCSRRYQNQFRSVTTSKYSSMPTELQGAQKTGVVAGGRSDDDAVFKTADGRHQYFILDRDATQVSAVLNSSA